MLIIPRRFNGPPRSANGGYACGLVAGFVPGDAEVTLRSPPPLETEMAVSRRDGRVLVHDGETLVAEAGPATIDHEVPAAPPLEVAAEATTRFAGFQRHEFPTCFTCGHERDDGLGILPGPIGNGDIVASPWSPDPSLPEDAGVLANEIVWAALDCPGAWTASRIVQQHAVVLGRMAARIDRPVRVGERLIAYAWPQGGEGRKFFAGTALATPDLEIVGTARQTWIALPSGPAA